MPDREKVMRGFECCLRNDHKKCPYYSADILDTTCYTRLHTDALALLKGEETRVMTMEEARETLHTADFLYCEDKNDDTMAGGLTRGVLNDRDYWDLSNGEYMMPDCLDEGVYLEAGYGKYFRFWTAKPSPEQMRDTKWEEDNETV